MKNNLEDKIRSAYEKITPDILDSVIEDCGEIQSNIIIIPEKRRKNMIKKITSIAVCAALLIGAGIIGANYVSNNAVSSVVSLDVNPSVEIRLNANEKVIGVNALNEDGKIIIGDMDFGGSSLDITVNALIGSMLRCGYISDITNSILVSVDGKDSVKTAEIKRRVADEISVLLESESFTGAVLSQTVSADDGLRSRADEYGITAGKAQLIEKIISQNAFYTFEELVPLSINELNLLSVSGNLHLENVDSTGKASDKAYIGEEAAGEIALTHAQVNESEIIKYEAELDYENGVMVYDIEFETALYEYEYEINAVSGEIVRFDKEEEHGAHLSGNTAASGTVTGTSSAADSGYIGEEAAKTAAFEHAGVNESDVYELEAELGKEKGIVCYEIDFKCGGYEYEYDINAADGTVMKYDRECDDDYHDNSSNHSSSSGASGEYIGENEAKNAALTHAGVNESEVTKLEVKLDYDDGKTRYEVEFRSGGYEYEYEIDAYDGSVLKSEKERD